MIVNETGSGGEITSVKFLNLWETGDIHSLYLTPAETGELEEIDVESMNHKDKTFAIAKNSNVQFSIVRPTKTDMVIQVGTDAKAPGELYIMISG